HHPLRVREVTLRAGSPAYSSDGAPSDCVSLAALSFLGYKPDLVVSGINKGPNLGDDITYSGTVAAAMEAVISELPAVAVSIEDYLDWHFETAAGFIARLVGEIEQHGIPSGVL